MYDISNREVWSLEDVYSRVSSKSSIQCRFQPFFESIYTICDKYNLDPIQIRGIEYADIYDSVNRTSYKFFNDILTSFKHSNSKIRPIAMHICKLIHKYVEDTLTFSLNIQRIYRNKYNIIDDFIFIDKSVDTVLHCMLSRVYTLLQLYKHINSPQSLTSICIRTHIDLLMNFPGSFEYISKLLPSHLVHYIKTQLYLNSKYICMLKTSTHKYLVIHEMNIDFPFVFATKMEKIVAHYILSI